MSKLDGNEHDVPWKYMQYNANCVSVVKDTNLKIHKKDFNKIIS